MPQVSWSGDMAHACHDADKSPHRQKGEALQDSTQATLGNVPRLSERESSQGHTGARATTSKVL